MNFYTTTACTVHFAICGAVFLGRYEPAMDAAEEMILKYQWIY
jgi:hypothetical protein